MAVIAQDITGADQSFVSGAHAYHGFSLRETAGAVATVRIHNGSAAGTPILDTVQLSALESAREWYDEGIAARSGIYIDVVAGTVEGSVRYS